VILSAGQDGDSPQFIPALTAIRIPRRHGGVARSRPYAVAADKAYGSRANRAYLRKRGIKAVIPEKQDQKAARAKKGAKGGRPPAFDAELYKRRNLIDTSHPRCAYSWGRSSRVVFLLLVVGLEEALAAAEALRVGADLAQPGEFVPVGGDIPAVGPLGLLGRGDPASGDPAVEGDRRHVELAGEVGHPPVVRAGRPGGSGGGAVVAVSQVQTRDQVVHALWAEALAAFGRP
jgi:hypothetical protein